jgi:hypothetical protein
MSISTKPDSDTVSPSHLILEIDIGSMIQQGLHDSQVTFVTGSVRRMSGGRWKKKSNSVGHIDQSSSRQQQRDQLKITICTSDIQRSLTELFHREREIKTKREEKFLTEFF